MIARRAGGRAQGGGGRSGHLLASLCRDSPSCSRTSPGAPCTLPIPRSCVGRPHMKLDDQKFPFLSGTTQEQRNLSFSLLTTEPFFFLTITQFVARLADTSPGGGAPLGSGMMLGGEESPSDDGGAGGDSSPLDKKQVLPLSAAPRACPAAGSRARRPRAATQARTAAAWIRRGARCGRERGHTAHTYRR